MYQRQSQNSRLISLHIKIPQTPHDFVANEAKNEGISMALYVAKLISEKQKLKQNPKREDKWETSYTMINPEFSLDEIELTDKMMQEKLLAYEKKYGITSEQFYQLFKQGKAPESITDKMVWASLFEVANASDDLE